jgi:hypothetical protein
MKDDEFCEVCGNGIMVGYRSICDDCKSKSMKELMEGGLDYDTAQKIVNKYHSRTNFEDAFGNVVREGDFVYAHGVNEGLAGMVTRCNPEAGSKAFNVVPESNHRSILFFNREWTKKEMNFQTWLRKRSQFGGSHEYVSAEAVKHFLSHSKHPVAEQVLKEVENAEIHEDVKIIPIAVWDDEYYNFEV